jgi:prepilin-type N-terminal cleavage/methylation domain-containing protein
MGAGLQRGGTGSSGLGSSPRSPGVRGPMGVGHARRWSRDGLGAERLTAERLGADRAGQPAVPARGSAQAPLAGLPVSARRGGFTLVELMVTIIVIGLLASVVGISWESMLPGQKLNTDIRVLSNLIAQTRSEAIARSAEFWMVYNFEQDAYWMLTPFDEEGQIQFDEEQRRALFKTKLAKGIHFDRIVIDGKDYDINDREVFVRFDALGSSSEHRIVLSQERPPALFTIEVLGLTGLIRFHDGLFEREEPRDSDFQ